MSVCVSLHVCVCIYTRVCVCVCLTSSVCEAAVVAHGTAVLEDEDGEGHDRQAHDEHHHPHRRAVGL